MKSTTRFPEKLLVSMPRDMRLMLTDHAKKAGKTDTEFVREAIRRAIGATENSSS